MTVTLSHSGKQHAYKVAKALLDLKSLDLFYTSSYIANPTIQRFLLERGDTYWTRRFEEGLGGKYVSAHWRFELKELAMRRLYGKTEQTQNAVYERDMSFDAHVAQQLRHRDAEVFWGFQGSCYQSLAAARELGKTTVCELATAHITEAKRILGEEARLHPEWADSIDNLVFPSHYEKRLVEEPYRADKVIAASAFTRQTLLAAHVPSNQIITLPLGAAIDYVPYNFKRIEKISQRPLKLLYAGTITQRKGIKYLLESMKYFTKKEVELRLIGGIQGSGQALKSYQGSFEHTTAISQMELFKLYSEYDALVLPTIFEGFGLVIVEAMAAGLPVITTPHSTGPELIEDDKNGYIIPIRDIEKLTEAIGKLRSKTDEEYTQMRNNARKSAENYSWNSYQQRLSKVLTYL